MAAVDTVTMMGRDYVDENSKKLIDNTFQATRLVRTMREGARKWPGGPAVTEYIMYAGSGGGPHKPNKRFTNQDRQFGQQLRWTPKLMQVPVGISLTDLRVFNAPNPYRVLSMLETNISAAYVTLGALWETLLFLPGQGASWLYNMNGYAEICNDNTSNSFDGVAYQMFGELDRTNANWGKAIKGNVKNVNNEIGYSILEQRYTKSTVGGAEPTVGYTTPLVKSDIKIKFQPQQRFQEAIEPTFGFVGFRFNRAIVIESRYCPGSEILNDDTVSELVAYATEDSSTPLSTYPLPAGSNGGKETFWWFNTSDEYQHEYISTDRIFGAGLQDFIPSAEHDMLISRVRLAHILAAAGPRYMDQLNQIVVNS